MMNNIEKLIENGGWRPIEEAKEGDRCWQKHGEIINTGRVSSKTPKDFQPSHIMYFDTPERMAKVIKEQYETIEILRNRLSIYDCQEQVDEANTLAHLQEAYVYACEALITINKIAGGEDA